MSDRSRTWWASCFGKGSRGAETTTEEGRSMARIRTIKPEIWKHPSIAGGSDLAVRLYIFLLTQADDYGKGRWDERRMFSDAFPGRSWEDDQERFTAAVDELKGWR